MISAEKVIIALDTQEREHFTYLLNEFSGHKVWLKVGMELFYSLGAESIYKAKEKGFNIFLDLKLHDIPNTVAKSLKSLSLLPIDMVNIHAAGGAKMMKEASLALAGSSRRPLLIAVTQLTSTTQEQMNHELRIPGDIVECVTHYAKLAKENGCDGVVASPLEVQAIKLTCGSKFLTVTPGIRPEGSATQDQNRITTPIEALRLGTDFMVIGRPITENRSPKEALEKILKGEQ